MLIIDKDGKPHEHPPAEIAQLLLNDGGREVTQEEFTARQAEMNTPPTETLDELKSSKQDDINNKYSSAVKAAQCKYSQCEAGTWDVQYAEATAYVADNLAYTPFIDCMIECQSTRSKDQLCNDIIANAVKWKEYVGALTGQRVEKFDLISAATSASEVDAVSSDFTIPEISLIDK